MTRKNTNTLSHRFTQKSMLGIALLITVVLCTTAIGYWFYSSQIRSAAQSVVFGNGQVMLDKKYISGDTEFDTISSVNGTTITVRLKYNNTASQSGTAATLVDSIPTQLSLKPGSIKNCYSESACVTIPDSVFSGNSMQIAPHAGYFGYSTTATQSNFELGRKKYVKLETDALYALGFSDAACNLRAENTPNFDNPSFCLGTDHYQDIMNADISGNRYLKLQTDVQSSSPGGYTERTCNLRSDNILLFGSSSFCQARDLRVEEMTADLLGKRYLKLQTDTIGSVTRSEKTCNLRSDNDPSFGTPSFCGGRDTNVHSMSVDLYDSARGGGYIEYQMSVGSTVGGLLGTNVTMSGSFGTLIDTGLNTIDIINCDVKNPANWIRNVTLSDAELRTDQDFTCNYQPKICPVVFLDLNNNGAKDSGEANSAGQSIELLRNDETTVVTTLITDAGGNSCFDSLAGGGTEYKIRNVNPLTIYPTTGSNIKPTLVSSSSTTTTIYFGYSAGILTMTAPSTTTFQTRNTQTTSQTSCANINPIQVTDSRITNPGWSLSATIENFSAPAQQANISVANKLSMNPGNVNIISGQNGTQQGLGKTVTSTIDPVSIMYSGSGSGLGIYEIDLGLCLQLDPYTQAGNYQSTITYTLI
jgi:SdrD B-like domain/WxL domain surface cell wall-binding